MKKKKRLVVIRSWWRRLLSEACVKDLKPFVKHHKFGQCFILFETIEPQQPCYVMAVGADT